jgi:hypothetical protein
MGFFGLISCALYSISISKLLFFDPYYLIWCLPPVPSTTAEVISYIAMHICTAILPTMKFAVYPLLTNSVILHTLQ